MPECSYGARAEQVVERWREFGAHRSIRVDEDAYEEGLVEELLDVVRRSRVSGTARLGEVEREAQVGLDALVMFGARAELLRSVVQACGNAVLLAFEKVQWDGSGVVGFHQFVALAFQLRLTLLEGATLRGGGASAGGDLCAQRALDLGS